MRSPDLEPDGDAEAPPAMREWAVKLETKPKYVVSSTRKDFLWTNSHHIADDLRTGVQKLKDATPDGVLLGSGMLLPSAYFAANAIPTFERFGLPMVWVIQVPVSASLFRLMPVSIPRPLSR